MGADNHPTPRVGNATLDMKRERLKNDLRACKSVSMVRDDGASPNGVVFKTEGTGDFPRAGDLSTKILRTLARHDTFLPREQPTDDAYTNAIIDT